MAHQPKVVEPRLRTPIPHLRDTGSSAGKLPDDLLKEQCTRLTLLYAVGFVLWAIGYILDHWLLPQASPGPLAGPIEIAGMAVSLCMVAYALFGSCGHQRKINIGLGLMIPNAFGIALLNSWVEQSLTMRPLSWITIMILIYAMVAPATPARMLAVSLVAASMDPLCVWIAHLRGLPVPSPLNTVLMFTPNYVCAGLAVVPSHVLHRLGRHIRTAREMGSYQLLELLGHGGMGEVWRAQHRLLARPAAIKLVRPELLGAGDEADAKVLLRRFEREAQATAVLSSPHTIRVFDFGLSNEGTFYYVMELLTGRDLESLIREFGPVPAQRAIFLLRQVCHSLADAHSRDLIHRDIKPANIYTCRMGLDYDFVKVLDFGLVKFRGHDVAQTLITAEHGTSGTPAYMAPEIILGEKEVDRRADVYALGCVAYFLLTGQLVFEADTPMKMVLQHVQARPVPPSQRTELPVPRELDDLVLACLEKNPDNRPRDAQELFRAACGFTSCDGWTSDAARIWWELHLPELSGPPQPVEPRHEVVGASMFV